MDQVDKRDGACVKRECTYTDRGKGLRIRSCDPRKGQKCKKESRDQS